MAASSQQQTDPSAYHQARAFEYRQEAARLQRAVHRYQLLAEIYRKGSTDRHPGFNPQGRANMVKRATRVMRYFAEEQQEAEQLAALHEKMAQFAQTQSFPPSSAPFS